MMESKDFISSIKFMLKNENKDLVSFNGQGITFRLPIKEIKTFWMTKTLILSRLFSNKKKNKIKPEMNNINQSQLPPDLQTYKQKILSGIVFFE